MLANYSIVVVSCCSPPILRYHMVSIYHAYGKQQRIIERLTCEQTKGGSIEEPRPWTSFALRLRQIAANASKKIAIAATIYTGMYLSNKSCEECPTCCAHKS